MNCRFCEIFKNGEMKPVYDKPLDETSHFYVVPVLGCLVKGYIMIVSKQHVNSMCYLEKPEKEELKALLEKYRDILKEIYGFYPVVFEHGSSNADSDMSAGSVRHAHMHMVPIKLGNQNEMIESLRLEKIVDLSKFFSSVFDKPYIFFMDNARNTYLHNIIDITFPSQTIRRWIAKDIGLEDQWDWRKDFFEENIITTIDELKCAMKERAKDTKSCRLRRVYYCRAMDGLNREEIKNEYDDVQKKLEETGHILVNPYEINDHNLLEINKYNARIIVKGNKEKITAADCVIVNLSNPDYRYVGCIGEMIYAKTKGCFVITIIGETNYDKNFYTLEHSDMIVKDLAQALSVIGKER